MSVNKVLVVDDMPVELEQIKSIVADAGVHVTTATSGEDALDKAKSFRPDLIFMDIVMPEMDGFAACRALAGDESTKDIPVVFVSSKDEKADKVWAQLQGGKAYVTKPYAEEDILSQIEAFR